MLVLFETPAGFALFKVLDEGKLKSVDSIGSSFSSLEETNKLVKLKAFDKFDDTTEALAAATAVVESKLSKGLKKFLKKNVVSKKVAEELGVADAKLGSAIKDKLGISCIYDNKVLELLRGIRTHMESLISGVQEHDMRAMILGLSHSLSRYKLKFSPDKVDTMIVQAVGLLDDLDKELNTYAMRAKEWYGWHFPELGKLVGDNVMFARTILKSGVRKDILNTDLSDILPEEIEQPVKEAAIVSMGTDISDEDIMNIKMLCTQIVDMADYRNQLYEYLKNRMQAIAPNLSLMVGELVGARLIAHAGSLINLAKHPASTVQILGAEKALFRALKTKHETPKYGIIYHASIVGGAPQKLKGKISRVLSAKTALSVRVDALGDADSATIAVEDKARVEYRLRQLEGGKQYAISGTGKQTPKYDPNRTPGSSVLRESSTYNTQTDFVTPSTTPKKEEVSEEKKVKKEKKKAKKEEVDATAAEESGKKKKKKEKKAKKEENDATPEASTEKKKKKKKKEAAEEAAIEGEADGEKKKKKKKKVTEMEVDGEGEVDGEKKKKKKKKVESEEVVKKKTTKKRKREETEEPEEPPKKKKKKQKTTQ